MQSHLRLEPLKELDNVRVLHLLQHLHLVVHHLFIALDILLQDNLDRHLAVGAICFANDTICACAEGPSESVL